MRTAQRGDAIRRKALDRLIGRGILEAEANGLVFPSRSVARARRYPTIDGETKEDVQFRVMTTLFSEDIPDPARCHHHRPRRGFRRVREHPFSR